MAGHFNYDGHAGNMTRDGARFTTQHKTVQGVYRIRGLSIQGAVRSVPRAPRQRLPETTSRLNGRTGNQSQPIPRETAEKADVESRRRFWSKVRIPDCPHRRISWLEKQPRSASTASLAAAIDSSALPAVDVGDDRS